MILFSFSFSVLVIDTALRFFICQNGVSMSTLGWFVKELLNSAVNELDAITLEKDWNTFQGLSKTLAHPLG